MPDEATMRVTQNWPTALKEEVEALTGKRGVTEFTLAAVRERLGGSDRILKLEQEVNDARYLCQLLADRYAMGGSASDREAALMEVELPSWLETVGWPEALAQQVAKDDGRSKATVEDYARSTATALGVDPDGVADALPKSVPCPYHKQDQQCEKEARHQGKHVAGDLEWGGDVASDPKPPATLANNTNGMTETPSDPTAPANFETPPGDALLAKIQAKAAEKGIDLGGAGLVPASTVAQPEPKAAATEHNHAWTNVGDLDGYSGTVYSCDCGATMDTKQVYAPGESPVSPQSVEEAVDESNEDLCPKCKEPMVAGECWNCM